jgi:large subunit ribosomal protein L33
MGRPKKLGQMLIKLVSTAATGFFYVTSKNPRNVQEKLKRVKFDPRVGKHVLFTESKLSR